MTNEFKTYSDDARRFAEGIFELHESLREGGPEVDWHLLQQYHDKLLDERETKDVGRLIVTWRPWYDAKIRLMELDFLSTDSFQDKRIPRLLNWSTRSSLSQRRIMATIAASILAIVSITWWHSSRDGKNDAAVAMSNFDLLASKYADLPTSEVSSSNADASIERLEAFSIEMQSVSHSDDQIELKQKLQLVQSSFEPMSNYLIGGIGNEATSKNNNAMLHSRIALRKRFILSLKVATGGSIDPAVFSPFYVRNAHSYASIGDINNAKLEKAHAENAGLLQHQFMQSWKTAKEYLTTSVATGDYQSAIFTYKLVLSASWKPKDWDVIAGQWVGNLLILNGDRSLGVSVFEAMRKSEDPLLSSTANARLGNWEIAAKQLQNLLAESEDTGSREYLVAQNNYLCCLLELHKHTHLSEELQTFRDLVAASTDSNDRVAFSGTIAEAYFEMGLNKEGFLIFENALVIIENREMSSAESIFLRQLYAEKLAENGRSELAVKYFRESLADAQRHFPSPNSLIVAQLESNLGKALLHNPGDIQEGAFLIAKAKRVLGRSELSTISALLVCR